LRMVFLGRLHRPYSPKSYCGGLFLSRCGSGGILAPGPRKTASQAIDVFKKIGRNILPQRIKDKLDALSPSHLGCWNEFRVARNKHDDLGLVFESDRGNVEADPYPYVDAFFLRGAETEQNGRRSNPELSCAPRGFLVAALREVSKTGQRLF